MLTDGRLRLRLTPFLARRLNLLAAHFRLTPEETVRQMIYDSSVEPPERVAASPQAPGHSQDYDDD